MRMICPPVEYVQILAEFGRTANMYSVTLIAGEGGLVNGKETVEVQSAYGDSVEAVASPAEGYGFAGWSDGWPTASRTIVVESDAEYEATFEKIVLTIVWEDWDGSVLFTDAAEYGSTLVYRGPEPVREGYDFAGWLWQGALYDFSVPVTADMTLTASWTPVEPEVFTVTFDVDGGSVAVEQQKIASGSMLVFPAYDGVKKGYEFSGWLCDGSTYQPGQSVAVFADTVAKIVWQESGGNALVDFFTGPYGIAVILIALLAIPACWYITKRRRRTGPDGRNENPFRGTRARGSGPFRASALRASVFPREVDLPRCAYFGYAGHARAEPLRQKGREDIRAG